VVVRKPLQGQEEMKRDPYATDVDREKLL